jgi:hypothetical protein
MNSLLTFQLSGNANASSTVSGQWVGGRIQSMSQTKAGCSGEGSSGRLTTLGS